MQARWTPQPGPQTEAIAATWCYELLYGGALGGGKSEFLLGDWFQDVQNYKEHWQGILFRQSYEELKDFVPRAVELFDGYATWHAQDREFRFFSGSKLRFRFLEHSLDYQRYMSHEYTWMAFEEAGNWPDSTPISMVSTRIRWSKADIPTKRVRLTANPGGAGHSYLFKRFVQPCFSGYVPIRDPDTKLLRMFIPSKLTDNPILLSRDPDYINRLEGLMSPELLKAWRDGDWSVQGFGAYFPEFGIKHVIDPFEVPEHWLRFGCFDWGTATPYAFLWCCVSDGQPVKNAFGDEVVYPRGAIIVYREECGYDLRALAKGQRKGTYLSTVEIGELIKGRNGREKLAFIAADPSIFSKKGKQSDAEDMSRVGLVCRPGNNDRIQGWSQIRKRLRGRNGTPMLYFFNTCQHIIRTLPALQHDLDDPNDCDTDGDDDPCDALRYGCSERPWVEDYTPPPTMVHLNQVPGRELVESHLRNMRKQRLSSR